MATMIHLHDGSPDNAFEPPPGRKKGLIPRNYNTHPKGCYASIPKATIRLLTDEEIIAAIKRKDAERSWLSDLRDTGNLGKPIPSRDQDGYGYCWGHSTASCCLLDRARDGSPYVDLSAFAVCCVIKNYRDEGGWGAESADFIANRGIPTSEFWPQQSTKRSNDNPKTWENAALNKITLKFADIPHNDHRMAASYIIQNTSVVFDIDDWSHSVAGCRVWSWNPIIFGIWNSWGDEWSENGMGKVSGRRLPNDMVAIDTVRVSIA